MFMCFILIASAGIKLKFSLLCISFINTDSLAESRINTAHQKLTPNCRVTDVAQHKFQFCLVGQIRLQSGNKTVFSTWNEQQITLDSFAGTHWGHFVDFIAECARTFAAGLDLRETIIQSYILSETLFLLSLDLPYRAISSGSSAQSDSQPLHCLLHRNAVLLSVATVADGVKRSCLLRRL